MDVKGIVGRCPVDEIAELAQEAFDALTTEQVSEFVVRNQTALKEVLEDIE